MIINNIKNFFFKKKKYNKKNLKDVLNNIIKISNSVSLNKDLKFQHLLMQDTKLY